MLFITYAQSKIVCVPFAQSRKRNQKGFAVIYLSCEVNDGSAYARQALRPCLLHGVPDVRRKRKKQKEIKVKRTFFVSAFRSRIGYPVQGGTVLIFCFVLHQGKMKDKPDRVRQ
ncbi:hypothetical protein CLV62_12140 [Dysgonomonas alginatilytica]|uniref:Uncharacterized protein n=1 Tax=Dysgonomonas alginatilytica TaxID=1605892 RepID=A0A2V3PKZ5_9BACT|nr:hypothetical protein [Dysgonomonas alginatilytica]PXV62217.1 hypothetical protein CLV62_12140 [Dysgonomonas alginatilytica]